MTPTTIVLIALGIIAYIVIGFLISASFTWAFGLSSSSLNTSKNIKLKRLGVWILLQWLWPVFVIWFIISVLLDIKFK